MNWFKLLRHDLRMGIKKRHWLPVLQFLIICIMLWFNKTIDHLELYGLDYMFYIYEGIKPLESTQNFTVPIVWLQIMSCPLYLNLHYISDDIQNYGQQVLIRSKSRQSWFYSKCCWNLLSSLIYFLSSIIAVLCVSFVTNRNANLFKTLYFMTHSEGILIQIPTKFIVCATIIAPFATIASFNMMQMVLSLFIRPVYAFVFCMSLLVTAAYIPSTFILGNGAMAVRSNLFPLCETTVGTFQAVIIAVATFGISIIIGAIGFKQLNILSLGE